MAYKLERFGTITLPAGLPLTDRGTGAIRPTTRPLPGGGVFDSYGAGQAPLDGPRITHEAKLVAESESALETAFYQLRALIGKRDKLWRRRLSSDVVEWTYARLVDIRQPGQVGQFRHLPMQMDFEMLSPVWYGHEHSGPWTLDSGELLDTGLYLDEASNTHTLASSPTNVVLTNGGHATVTNAIITVTAGSAPITNLILATTGVGIQYTGTILAGQSLVINAGAKSVKNNGASDYANFTLVAGHTMEEWFPLRPGNNSIVVTFTGGGGDSTITFEYSDGWL